MELQPFLMRNVFASIIALLCSLLAGTVAAEMLFSGERRVNNLVSELLEVSSISGSSNPFTFTRPSDGWIDISLVAQGEGTVRVILDEESRADTVIVQESETSSRAEAMRFVVKGAHTVEVECKGKVRVEKLAVKAIPELIHCGLGFNPEIKSYGLY